MGGTGGNEMDRLKEIIQVIDRPLAFAERGGTVALKDLGRFISRQVTDALAEQVRPSAIEAELLRLAQLFTDYEQLPPGKHPDGVLHRSDSNPSQSFGLLRTDSPYILDGVL